MSKQELFEQHKEEKCKNCNSKNCTGITITIDNKTKCDVYAR